jgi:hypothetical protein
MQESSNLMRVLEALKTLEDAVLDCKLRAIDTPELHAALDAVEPLSVAGVARAKLTTQRDLKRWRSVVPRGSEGSTAPSARCYTGRSANSALYTRQRKPRPSKRSSTGTAELTKLPERWEFYVRQCSLVANGRELLEEECLIREV